MYILKDGNSYVGVDEQRKPTIVSDASVATTFKTEVAARNYMRCMPTFLKVFSWEISENEPQDSIEGCCDEYGADIEGLQDYSYVVTDLEDESFDICNFFSKVIDVMSQLDRFMSNMGYMEGRINLKILDVRHYMRDNDHKLNAIQMQRLGYYLQSLEKRRYKCKANRLIAAMFSADIRELKNKNNIEKMNSFFTNKYRPRVLEDEEIEAIINTKKDEIIKMELYN